MAVNQEESSFPEIKFGNTYIREEFPNKNMKDLDNSWNLNCETGNSHIYTDGKVEKLPDDIVDLLPKDPFGMDISATVTTITGLIEDFSLKNLGFESGEDEDESVDDQLLAQVNIVWNSANGFHADLGNLKSEMRFTESSMEFNDGICDGVLLDGELEDILGFNFDKYWTPPNITNNRQGYTKSYVDSVRGPPPDALSYALSFLGLRDLLTVERVCKSLRDDVQTDPLLWRNVHVDYPLNRKITDDDLLLLTKRAQSTLESLSLVDCPKITDCGLKRVLESNPGLTKLNVAGCQRLSVEGIIGNMRFFKSVGRPGIKYLRIGGILGVTSQHFEELKFLLGIQNQKQQQRAQKPRFYQAGQLSLSFDDERKIDIEICPRCQKVRQVYDCPADGCKGKLQTLQACRACIFCISRCMSCGRCLSNCDYEETFGLDLICLDCLKQIFNLQEGQTRMTILPHYLNQQRLEIGYHLVVSAAICDATRMNCMPQLWSEMQNLHLLARGHGCALSCFGDLHME